MENDVITNLNDNLSAVDIEIKQVYGRVNEFYRSLGKYKWFNSLTDPYWLCLRKLRGLRYSTIFLTLLGVLTY